MTTSFDQLVDQFEDELRCGKSPRIEAYLSQSPKESRERVLREFISVEVFHKTKEGQPVRALDYARFGESAASHAERVLAENNRTAVTEPLGADTTTQPPETIGPYRLLNKIGEGGMGAVWLAQQEEPVERKVALKLIRAGLATKEASARFDIERQALAMMDHPNIARVLDAGTTKAGLPYFAMELVEGIPITRYCDQNKLSIDERLQLFVAVCRAIQHAHQKGVLHRDIKPSNVLVSTVDGNAVPKVIDFGLAKTTEHTSRLTDKTLFTEFGAVVGTLQYMSPEQARLSGADVDTRTDIYSLGVMLYELLTGTTPIDKQTVADTQFLEVLEMIRERDAVRPSVLLRHLPAATIPAVTEVRRISTAKLRYILRGELDWVVIKALEKDRARRYQTANAFGEDIASYLSGDAVTARPPSAAYRMRKFTNKNRGLVTAVFAIGLALVIGIAGTSYGLLRANRKTSEAETSRRIAENKTTEALASEKTAVTEKENARISEKRAIAAEKRASAEASRAQDASVDATFQLAVARFEASRAVEARGLLHEIPVEYRDSFEWHVCNRMFQGSDITCYGHTGVQGFGGVYGIAASPNGEWVASGSGDGSIKLWDPRTGKEIATLRAGKDGIKSIAVSPDGTRIATGSFDSFIRLWDVASREVILTLDAHSAAVNCLTFSPNGEILASASSDKTIKLWDPETGDVLSTITGHGAEVSKIAFSPDGGQLASTSRDRTVRVWDCESAEQITIVRRGRDTRGVTFSPNGRRLITTSYGIFSVFDTRTWKLIATSKQAHNRMVECVAFSPDGTLLATGADDATIKLWDAKSGRMLRTLSGHAKIVLDLAFTHDGTRLVSGSRDRTVRLWNLTCNNELTLDAQDGQLMSVAFSRDRRRLASGSQSGKIVVWDMQTHQRLLTLEGHRGSVEGLDFSPDGTRLASGSYDRTIRIWDTTTGDELATLEGHTDRVRGVAFAPDGNRLASASSDRTIKIWDVGLATETATLTGHRGGLYSVAFSPDGSQLASASFDRTVKLWDAQSGREIQTFVGHNERVRSVAFGPRGNRIVSSSNDGTARVWDVASAEPIAICRANAGPLFGVAISPDGQRIATASTDRKVSLFNANSGREIVALNCGAGGVASVRFSSDGTRLAAAAHDGNVHVWNAQPDRTTNLLRGHTNVVTRVRFSSDGSTIYSEAAGEKLVWDVETQQLVPDATWDSSNEGDQTSADGRWFVTMEANHVLLIDRRPKSDQTKVPQ